MSIRVVHFDFDGTLAYMAPTHLALYVRAAAEVGIELTEETVDAGLSAGWRPWTTPDGVDHSDHSHAESAFLELRARLHTDRLRAALAGPDAGAAPEEALDTAGRRVAALEAAAAPYHLFDDVLPVLDALEHRAIASVIVSNHVWTLPEIVTALGVRERFRAVITSARVGYRKPHPEIYREACAALPNRPGEILFVGDSLDPDVTGPRRAGMHAVLLDREGRHPDEPGAITTLAALPAVIDRIDADRDSTPSDDPAGHAR